MPETPDTGNVFFLCFYFFFLFSFRVDDKRVCYYVMIYYLMMFCYYVILKHVPKTLLSCYFKVMMMILKIMLLFKGYDQDFKHAKTL